MSSASQTLVPILKSKNVNVDYKEKQFYSNVEKALQLFDFVDDWADYISRLGKLLKALQSWSPKFQNTSYYVPHPYQVARRLASSLAPDLPSGVHSKTLEVYSIIFDKIGIDALSKQCNIWIPGILPLMTCATLSVKPQLIDLYESYILKMDQKTLEVLVKPILASLLPGIDEEGSEFQQQVLLLISSLKEALGNDSLFWQCFYIIMIKNKEHRLGGLVWMTKQMPSLNAIPHLASSNQEDKNIEKNRHNTKKNDGEMTIKEKRAAALNLLLPNAISLVQPEVGLLIRCLVACLENANEIMIQRGILDLVLQRLHLDSPVLEKLVSKKDKEILIMACCQQLLKKDMSLNRRIWNWLLKPFSKTDQFSSQQYFKTYCLDTLIQGLETYITEGKILESLKITQILMHKWEIGSLVTEKLFLPLMRASIGKDEKTTIAASEYFDSIDIKLIWKSMISTFEDQNLEVLEFILNSFNLENEDEMIIKHLPLIFLRLYVSDQKPNYKILNSILSLIPERAYLPEEDSVIKEIPSNDELVLKINNFYASESTPSPFSIPDLTKVIISKSYGALIHALKNDDHVDENIKIFISLSSVIPNFKSSAIIDHQEISDILTNLNYISMAGGDCTTLSLSSLFVECLAPVLDTVSLVKNLKLLIESLWNLLKNPSEQQEALKSLENIQAVVPQKYMEAAVVSAFLGEEHIENRLVVLNCLWHQTAISTTNNYALASKPLELILDELSDENNSSYVYVFEWLQNILLDPKTANKLFEITVQNLLSFEFILQKKEFNDFDNIEIFTYYITTLNNILNIGKSKALHLLATESTSTACIKLFSSANISSNTDVSTYKRMVVEILLKFLSIKSNKNSKSVRVVLKFFHIAIDGSESNFKRIVSLFLDFSSNYIKGSSNSETDLIIVSLLDIVSNVLALSHEKNIKLDIFDNSESHLQYVDFLVSSVLLIQKPSVMSSYVRLMTESIIYFQEGVFNIILPLVSAMVSTVNSLFDKEYASYTNAQNMNSVSTLFDGIEELLQVAHSYMMSSLAKVSAGAGGIRVDFLSNVVSNVFSGNVIASNGALDAAAENRILVNRQVVVQSFATTIKCCHRIWEASNTYEKGLDKTDIFSVSLYQQSCKYKYKSRKLLEKLFLLEPAEFFQCLLDLKENFSISTIQKLVYALDGNRPLLTLPHFFKMCMYKHNSGNALLTSEFKLRMSTTSSLFNISSSSLIDFIYEYVNNLEFSAVEDINTDMLQFMKEVTSNASQYEDISIRFMELVSMVCFKMDHCQFGEDKKIRKEYSDIMIKYVASLDYELVQLRREDIYSRALPEILSKIEHVVNEEKFSDKYNVLLSSLITTFITPFFKKLVLSSSSSTAISNNSLPNKDTPENVTAHSTLPNYVVQFMALVAPLGKKTKPWKSLINDFFFLNSNISSSNKKGSAFKFQNKFSNCLFNQDQKHDWETIIYCWSQYPDVKEKLFGDLFSNCSSVNTNPFGSWSQSEVDTKCLDYFRVCYLLCVSPVDTYSVFFKQLIVEVERICLNENNDIEPEIVCMGFKLLRVMLVKFNRMQFLNSWCSISFILQKNLQIFYETGEKININVVFQIVKTLDVLVALNFEDFSSTQEWLFIVETINEGSRNDVISLIDLMSKNSEFATTRETTLQKPLEFSSSSLSSISFIEKCKLPLFYGRHELISYTELKSFVDTFSYANYESLFHDNNTQYSEEEILDDVLSDLFYAPQFFV